VGLNRNRLDFNLNFQWQLLPPLINVLPFILYFSHVFFFAVDIRIHSKLSIKTAAIPCSRLRRLCPPLIFSRLLALYCSINHTSHAFASRTGIVSLPNSVQIRKAKFKVVQNSDYGRLTSLRKTQMAISPGVLASIHYIGRPSSATLLIYSPGIALLPCVSDSAQGYFFFFFPPYNPVLLVFGKLIPA